MSSKIILRTILLLKHKKINIIEIATLNNLSKIIPVRIASDLKMRLLNETCKQSFTGKKVFFVAILFHQSNTNCSANLGAWYRTHNTPFSSQLTNWPIKVDCFIKISWKGLQVPSTLTYGPVHKLRRKWSIVNTHPGILICVRSFVQLGLNKADTLKSSSILIYLISRQDIYIQEMLAKPGVN